jgi:putative ABC transport system permease protein
MLNRIGSFLRGRSHRAADDRDLDSEVRAHAEMLADEKVQQGMSSQEARRAARLEMGGIEQVKEEVRGARPGVWLETFWQDVRFGARTLRKNPGFTAVAVLTLALGIGANTAIFSVVEGVLLRPLPYKDPSRLVMVSEKNLKRGFPEFDVTPPDFIAWRAQNQVFSSMAAIRGHDYALTGAGTAEREQAAEVSPEFFGILGVPPELGRGLQASDDDPGKPPAVVISHRLWRDELAGDPHVIGRVLALDSKPYTVVGVMPPSFVPPFGEIQIWTDLLLDDGMRAAQGFHDLSVIARLRPGTSLRQADADIQTISGQLETKNLAYNAGWSALLRPLQEEIIGDIRTALLVLQGAVSFVLLIACANVANLQLARASARLREMAIRGALGAGRARIVRQILTENFLLAVVGSALGLLLAWLGTGALLALDQGGIPRQSEVGINGYVLGFAVALAFATALLFGLVPALQSSSINLTGALKQGAGGRGPSAGRLRSFLVVSEVALALVLLVGGGLLVRSFRLLLGVPSGLNSENVLTFSVTLPDAEYPKREDAEAFFRRLIARVQQIPGVDSAGAVSYLPLSNQHYILRFRIEGQEPLSPLQATSAEFRVVTPDYFLTMGIPLLRGREFTDADGPGAARLAMINQSMAIRFFANADPIGQNIIILGVAPYRIVGIVGDVRQFGLDRSPKPEIYAAQNQEGLSSLTIVARTKIPPLALASTITNQVRALDSDLPVYDVRSMQQVVDTSVGDKRFSTYLFAIFSLLALALAAIGIYGVTSFTVARGTREIGIRMALGARQEDVLRQVLWSAARLAVIGIVAGILGSFALTRLLKSLLFGVRPSDPLTLTIAVGVLASTALLACWIPARRASRVDPMVSLRYE